MTGRKLLVVLAVWSLVAVAGFGAGANTHALFVDAEAGSGTIQAADSFNRNPGQVGPPGQKAYDDANGNGRFDQGEATYNANKLRNFDDASADLVVPSDVDTIERNGNGDISVRAGSLSSSAGFAAQNGGVDLTATNGGISIEGETIDAETSNVLIEATGDIDLSDTTVGVDNGDITVVTDGVLRVDGATFESNGDIELRAKRITAEDASIQPGNGGSTLSATRAGGGTLDMTAAYVSGGNSGISIESTGDLWLNHSTLTSQTGDAAAVLTENATLYVGSMTIQDSDDVLEYSPDNVTVVPSRSNVQPA